MALKQLVFPINCPASGGFAPRPRISDTLKLLVYSTYLPIDTFSLLTLVNDTTGTYHPLYDIFVPQKVPLSKISDHVVACDLRSPPPIENPGYAYVLVVVFLSKVYFEIYFN